MNKIKTFLVAFGTGILTAALFFLRRKGDTRSTEVSKARVERDQSDMKLKQAEAKLELEKKYSGLSDSDIVLNAINEKLGSVDEPESKTNKSSR